MLIVLIFKSSASLAAAYGIAVTGVMVIDTFHAGIVATRQWNWNIRYVIALFGMLAAIDWAFLASNSLKIVEGGWLPLAIATAVFLVMETWRKGRRHHQDIVRDESMPLDLFLARAEKTPMRVAGTAVFLNARADIVPGSLLHNLKHNRVLHERVVLAHVIVDDTPMVAPEKRVEVVKLGKGFYSVKVHHGFFETPDVPLALKNARAFGSSSTSSTRPSSSAARRWCRRSIPCWEAGAPGSICSFPPTPCRPRGSTACRRTGSSSSARRSRSDLMSAAMSQGPTASHHHGRQASRRRTAILTLGALGVVFGDIGTSPLYAMRESALAAGGAMPGPEAVLGALSLIFWSLMIVVTLKYVTFIMQADNDGEGGVLALAALAHRSPGLGRWTKTAIGVSAILGLALFYGDGMLTPAISVLSAVEGLGEGGPRFQTMIMPIALVILVGLFLLQSRGTDKIGKLFGP